VVWAAEALRAECGRLAAELDGLGEADFGRPTRCVPWTVAELLAHVRTATGRLTAMLADPAPATVDVDAAGYYRPGLFGAEINGARIERARQDAAAEGGPGLVADFDRTWRAVADQVAAQPPGRLVRTRHGDGIRLDDFLLTRVVEVGVHGLDLADALGRDPWLTEPAAAAIASLLASPGTPAADASSPSAGRPAPNGSGPAGRADGSAVNASGAAAGADRPAARADGPVASTGGPVASTGGPLARADAPVASTGGPVASTGDPVASTGGPVASTGGPVAGGGGPVVGEWLGWDRLTFIRKATGRLPLTETERADVDRYGVRWLTLG